MDELIHSQDIYNDESIKNVDIYSYIGKRKLDGVSLHAISLPKDGAITIRGVIGTNISKSLNQRTRRNSTLHISAGDWQIFYNHSMLFDRQVPSEPKQKRLKTISIDDNNDTHGLEQSRLTSIDRRSAGDVYTLKTIDKSKYNDKVYQLNKREELISQMDGAFEKEIPAEEFVMAFRNVRKYLDETMLDPLQKKSILSSICAVILSDPSFRLKDLKTKLSFNHRFISNYPDENTFMTFWFRSLIENVIQQDSLLNCTTKFNINALKKQVSGEMGKGLHTDTRKEKEKFLGVATFGSISDVCHLSYMLSADEGCDSLSEVDKDKLIRASFSVIEFIVSNDPFDSANNREKVASYKVNHDGNGKIDDIRDLLEVPGGILFPFLTLLLIIYRNLDRNVTIAMETYGGKSKGIKTKFKPGETSVDDTTNQLLESEKNKAARLFYRFLRALEESEHLALWGTVVKIGVGGENAIETAGEAWVCQPVQLRTVESMRNNPTRQLFVPVNTRTPQTSGASNDGEDDDEDDDDDDFERPESDDYAGENVDDHLENVTKSDGRYKHHPLMKVKGWYSMFPILGSMLGTSLQPVTVRMGRAAEENVLWSRHNQILKENPKIIKIQSYSPTVRYTNGFSSKKRGGVNEVADSLLNYRSGFGRTLDGKKFLNLNEATKCLSEWTGLAKKHLNGFNKHMIARLEITINLKGKTVTSGLDEEICKSLRVLTTLFQNCSRSYDSTVLSDLGMIHLLALEGRGEAVINAMNFPMSSLVLDEYCSVWAELTFEARKFFTGRGSLFSELSYAPRLSIATGRAFLSFNRIHSNYFLLKPFDICDNVSLNKLVNLWYENLPCNNDLSLKSDKTRSMLDNLVFLENDVSFALNGYIKQSKSNARSNQSKTFACTSCWKIYPWEKPHDCDKNCHFTDVMSDVFDRHLISETDKLDECQKIALLHILRTDKNILLTGVAGSGKSFTTNILYKHFVRQVGYDGCRLTATTNAAAALVNAETVYSFLGIIVNEHCNRMVQTLKGIEEYYTALFTRFPSKIAEYLELSTLFIDEASMLRIDLLVFLDAVLRYVRSSGKPFGGVRIIFVGDMLQLPPTPDKRVDKTPKRIEMMFFVSEVFYNGGFDVVYLKGKPHRQNDETFIELLNCIRIGNENEGRVIEMLNDTKCFGTLVNRKIYHMAVTVCAEFYNRRTTSTVNQLKYNYLYANRVLASNFNMLTVATRGNDNTRDIGDTIICTTENLQNDLYIQQQNKSYEANGKEGIRIMKFREIRDKDGNVLTGNLNIDLLVQNEFDNVFPNYLILYEGQAVRLTHRLSDSLYVNKQVTIISFRQNDEYGQIVSVRYKKKDKVVTEEIKMVTIAREVIKDQRVLTVSITSLPIRDCFSETTWKLQGAEVEAGFGFLFDNSRCIVNYENKGLFYTACSRCQVMEQLAILHSVLPDEIRLNVDRIAVLFDTYHSSKGVISSVDYHFDRSFRMYRNEDKEEITTKQYCPWLHKVEPSMRFQHGLFS